MFGSNYNHGFTMTFKNGITISVQFGPGNYCERRGATVSYRGDMDGSTPIVKSKNAEIAIWDENGKWFSFGNDTVKGWVDTEEVGTWIILCTAATSLFDLKTRATGVGLIEKVEA